MRFTERERELTGLTAALDRARLGRGTTVLVSGEAGIGKTSLISAFCQRHDAGARVFRGSCEDLLTPRPLGPFRDMARGAGPLDASAVADREALIDTLLTEMSFVQRPAVVIVEDVQWADQASLDVLRFLIRRTADLPALLVVSYREEDLYDDNPLLRVAAATPSAAVLRLPLAGLSDAAVGALAEEAGADPDTVIATVAGNPFHLSEVLAAPGSYVPTSVRHAVMARVAALSEDARMAIEQLSVLPGEWDTDLLGLVIEDRSVLDPAERAGIVVWTYAGIRFRHELGRRSVEASLTSARRTAAHRRVLEALITLDAEPSRLVHHAVALGDDRAVAEHAERAAQAAADVNGHREVVRFVELALRHGTLSGVRRARLHLLAATADYGMNRFGAAAAQADSAVEALEAADSPAELGRALLLSSRIRIMLADPAAARAHALRAVQILQSADDPAALAFGHSLLGAQDAVQTRFTDAMARSEDALRLAEAAGADEVVAHALIYRGVARTSLGDDGGLADLEQAISIAAGLRHGDFETVASHNLAVMHLRAGRVAAAEPHLERAAAVAREHNLDIASFRIEAQLCQCLLLRGHWAEAERRLRLLIADADDPGANAANPLSFLGRILARRGDPLAAEHIQRAWTLAVATTEDQKLAVAGGARIELLWLNGDLDAVRVDGQELLRIVLRAQHPYLRAEVLRYLRRAGVDVGPFPGCPPAFAAGLAGDWATAARHWAQAGNPYERALELSESPDPTVVREAFAVLDRLGATGTAAVLRQRLRRTGMSGIPRGPRESTRADPEMLTQRQRDVLALVAQGMTNAEIAQRLVLSRRTIDNHVAAVLQRLGVASRREAARLAAGGPTGPDPVG